MLSAARRGHIARIAILAVIVGACAPGVARPPDADPPAIAPAIPWLAAGSPDIAPPVIPWLGDDPITRPCATGWRAAPRRSGVACEPWPEAGRAACTGPSAHFPGEEGCRVVGAACPDGDFSDGLPAGAIHVRPGATGTTGSAADPVGTIAEALALVTAGGTIALSRGAHEGDVLVGAAVELRGACAEATRIAGTLRIAGNVVVRDTSLGSLRVEGGAAEASGVWIEDAPATAIDVSGGALSIDDVVLRGGTIDPAGATFAIRVSIGRLDASRIAIESAPGRAVLLTNGGSASIEGSVIADTRVGADGRAIGIFSRAGAGDLALTRSVVQGGVGALVAIEGGEATLEDVLIADGAPVPGERVAFLLALHVPTTGRGIQLRDVVGFGVAVAAGRTELEDVIVESSVAGTVGLHAEIAGTLSVQRARVGPIGIGLQAYSGGQLEASDVLVFESTDHVVMSRGDLSGAIVRRFVAEDCARGVRAGDDSTLTLEDAVLRDIENEGLGDDAIGAFLRSVVTARRITAERVSNSCFVALQPGSTLTLEDATCSGGTDLAVLAAYDGLIDASRLRIADAIQVGIASEGATVHARDVVIERVGPAEQVASAADAVAGGELTLERARLVEIHGYGASSQGVRDEDGRLSRVALTDVVIESGDLGGVVTEARAELTRVSIDGATEIGISSASAAGIVILEDVAVRDVGSRDDGQLGRGVHVGDGGRLEGARLVVARTRGAGLLVTGPGSTVALADLWVSETTREECGDRCAARAAGSGIVATEGGAAAITGLRSWGNVLAGVQVASAGTLDLRDGWVFDNAIGRSVLSMIGTEQLTLGVVYVDNDIEESAESVSVPAPTLF